ncbi:MAG: TRAP transporter small permease [Arenicella sp.]
MTSTTKNKFQKCIDTVVFADKWLTKLLEYFLITLFFGFFVLLCILVIMRYTYGGIIVGGNEGITIAFIYTVAIGSALAITRQEHIAITFFIDFLPLPFKKMVFILQLLLIIFINVILIKYSINWITLTGAAPWVPLAFSQGYFQAAIPLGCGLVIFFCIVKILLTLAGRESVETIWMPED